MTTTPVEDAVLGSALAMLWQRHRQTNLDRISLLEETAADVLRGVVDDDATAAGASAAHKLAGSLGTFGFDAGSRAALEAETLLREPVIDGRLLAEAVTALRASVDGVGDSSGPIPAPAPSDDVALSSDSTALLVSSDPDLISRLTVEGAAIGLRVLATAAMPLVDAPSADLPDAVIVDVAGTGSGATSDTSARVAELSSKALVVVLTDGEGFDDLVGLARAGAAGVIPRAQGARQTMAFLAEALAQRNTAPSTVLVLDADPGVLGTLGGALVGPECRVGIRNDPADFWETLQEQGADLVIVRDQGAELSGPDMCRVIRAHPRWHRTPVIVVGKRNRVRLDEAMAAGADDYMDASLPAHDLGVRLHRRLAQARLARDRSDTDPLTGAENRTSAEGSLDRLLRLAARHGAPLAFALVAVDQFDQMRQAEGKCHGRRRSAPAR